MRFYRIPVIDPVESARRVLCTDGKCRRVLVGHIEIARSAQDVAARIRPLEGYRKQRCGACRLEHGAEENRPPVHRSQVTGGEGVDTGRRKIAVG